VASTRPRMSGPVDAPMLQDTAPARVLVHLACIRMASANLSVLDAHAQVYCAIAIGRAPLRNQLLAVARVNFGIVISVKYDCRDAPRAGSSPA